MSYQVIARKWRPQTFTSLVGQNHVTQTLSNALKNGRIHHALLFTGPRGTGKTSSARILAKALRCPNAVDFVPCGKCTSCMEIAASRSMDVQELDAASNNSVEDVRKLLEGVMGAPSSGKYKIYIIDEVHMLSTAAFNALLKTLEEPPAHVVFIMATTEVHKIPETILSRCQRFDFKRIPTRTIADHLKAVASAESVKADDEALWMIARQGDGSMRDALSLLDQVITFANGALSKDVVVRILGLTDRNLLLDTIGALKARDPKSVIRVLEKISASGFEPRLFAQDLLEMIRHLLVVKVSASEMSEILDLPDSELKAFAEISSDMTEEEIHLLFDMALKGGNDIPRAQDPRLVLEMTLLRMASAPRIADLQSLLGGVPQPRRDLREHPPLKVTVPEETARPSKSPGPAAKSAPLAKPSAPSASTTIEATPQAAVPRPPSAAPRPAAPASEPEMPQIAAGATAADRWLHFVELVRSKDALFAAKIENLVFSGIDGKTLRLGIPAKLTFLKEQLGRADVRSKLQGYLESMWEKGSTYEIGAGPAAEGERATKLAEKKQVATEEDIREKIKDHPLVQEARTVFGGEIKSITPLNQGVKQ